MKLAGGDVPLSMVTSASVQLGPVPLGHKWHITRMTVQTVPGQPVVIPECRVYRSAIDAARFVDGTMTGNLDVSETDLMLDAGESLVFVWGTSDANVHAYASIEGDQL